MKFKLREEEETPDFKEEFCTKGRAADKKVTDKDVNFDELRMGMEVEKEHTTSEQIAKKIALDHLAEIKDYYTRLKKMEDEAKKEGEDAKDKEEEKEEKGEDEKDEDKDKEDSLKV